MSDLPSISAEFAEILVQTEKPQFRATVHVTPQGILAIGALVSGILLSTSLLVWVAAHVRHAARH
jgi:hypothetical protein